MEYIPRSELACLDDGSRTQVVVNRLLTLDATLEVYHSPTEVAPGVIAS
jgi:hypothetical protein